MLERLNILLIVEDLKPDPAFEVQSMLSRCNCFTSPADNVISDAIQHAVGLLGHLGTLLACVQPTVGQHPQILFC